jgi:hypothetical protein
MSDIEILKALLQESARVALETSAYDKTQVKLEEAEANYSITIHQMPEEDEVVIFKPDILPPPTALFTNSKGEWKRSDFVIVANTQRQKVIICIELKGGKGGSETEIKQQLMGARCLVAYCRAIGREFWQRPDFLEGYGYRFVSIREIKLNKKPTRTKAKSGLHDGVDRLLKITSPSHLTFKGLVGS